jgi:hypothetical protein
MIGKKDSIAFKQGIDALKYWIQKKIDLNGAFPKMLF